MTTNPHDEAAALLTELAKRGIELRAHDGKLRYRPRSAMTGALARRLMVHKAIVLAVLNHRPDPGRIYSVEAEIERFEAACVRSPTGGWVDPAESAAWLYPAPTDPEPEAESAVQRAARYRAECGGYPPGSRPAEKIEENPLRSA
jgi:hypothetical protein